MYYLEDKEYFDLKMVLRALEHFNEKAHSGTIANNLIIIRCILKRAEERKENKQYW